MPEIRADLCAKIRDRVDKWEKYWTINRSLYYEWIDFVLGDQWREDESKLFERYNKIPLMMNKLGVLTNHMLGDQIQNTPNLQISPDEDVPVQEAQVRAALVKNISLNSDAKTVYQTAYGQAVVGGYGAYRIGTEYLHKRSFKQQIKIYDFSDPNMCYWDIAAKHRCKTDGMYSGFKTRVSRKWFRNKYGKNIESQIGSSSVTEDSTMAFADDDSITIVDDFEKEGKSITLYHLSDDSVVDEKEFKALEKVKIDGKKIILKDGMPVTVLDKRDEVEYTIKHRQIAGDYVLDETDFPVVSGEILPVIFVDQRSYYTKQGQQITRSFFKDVKDAQKYLNYIATQSAYMLKISRYDQFIMPRKCAAAPDTMQQWRDPSVVNGALYYDEVPSGDKPEQLRPPELSQSLMQQYERTLMDISSGTGLYNTQLGEMGNEVSGTAINNRNKRGNKNTQIPRNSLDISIAMGGELINDMIPKVYDTERDMVLPMPDAEDQRISINKPADEYGLSTENDMTQGRYKIRLKPGPSYEEQKQEALESLQLVLNADHSGQVFPMIADLYVENLPLDNNIELRNRLRTMVPPEIIEAGKTGKPLPPKQPQPSPDELKMQMKQQELQQKEQHAQMEFQAKMQKMELEKAEIQRKAIESHQDMTMAWEKLMSDEKKAQADLEKQMLIYKAEQDRLEHDMMISTHKVILDHHAKMVGHGVNHSKNQQTKQIGNNG
jgi:hypothetical protein